MNVIEAALEGRIGKPPTMRTAQSGKPWCSFSVAVGGDDNGGATWVGVSAFGSQAEALAALAAGARVYVEGRLKLETWTDSEGRERTGLKVAATLVQPMGQIGHRKPAKARTKASGEDGEQSSAAVYRPLENRSTGAAQPAPRGDGGRGFDAEIPF